jgi:DNA-binding CsgD family transcriptional regulator
MAFGLKEKILQLRLEGKTYDEIKNELNCSKSTISYHCKNHGLDGNDKRMISDNEKVKMNEYYKTHSIDETAEYFKINRSTVIKYVENKHIKLTKEQLRINNYNHVKSFRQKLKEKAVEYKGGRCEKCGYNKCIIALEFHHMNPLEKDFNIGKNSMLAWGKVKKELDKCILVCANCHREIHYEQYKLCSNPPV